MKLDTTISLNCQEVEIHEETEVHFMMLTWHKQTGVDDECRIELHLFR